MQTNEQIWQKFIHEQVCKFCHNIIDEQRYFQVPGTGEYVHSICLALDTQLKIERGQKKPSASIKHNKKVA
jgi:hypothetical protein